MLAALVKLDTFIMTYANSDMILAPLYLLCRNGRWPFPLLSKYH